MANRLAAAPGLRFEGGHRVSAIHREGTAWVLEGEARITAERVVVTVGPHRVTDLVSDAELAQLMRRAVEAPVAVVFLAGDAPGFKLLPGFGYLAGPDSGLYGVGCLFESEIDPTRSPPGRSLVKVICGGARAPGVVDWDDDRLVGHIGDEVARVLGHDLTADLATIVRHRPGIPQYEGGHRGWLKEIDRQLGRMPGLLLGGWAYRGIGISHLATDAVRIADAIARPLR